MPNPTVTYFLMTYRHAAFVREAVASAFAQEYSPLEIVLSDDCSPDETFEILCEEHARYRGPHTVRLNRNPANLRLGHWNKVAGLARGDLIVVAHGDDVAFPQRTATLAQAQAQSGASLVSSNAIVTDVTGTPKTVYCNQMKSGSVALNDIIAHGWMATMLGATFAFRREVLERFPPIDSARLPVGSDHVLPFRAGLLGGVHYVGEPLLRYRRHAGNASNFIADYSGPREAMDETYAAYCITSALYILEELSRWGNQSASFHVEAVRSALAQNIFLRTQQWIQTRNKLLNHGLFPVWVDRATRSLQKAGQFGDLLQEQQDDSPS